MTILTDCVGRTKTALYGLRASGVSSVGFSTAERVWLILAQGRGIGRGQGTVAGRADNAQRARCRSFCE